MSASTDQTPPEGRLVSLSDGREYELGGRVVVIGRDEGCDVVIAGRQVSRRHAEVVPTPSGYDLVDTSSNGTVVNGRAVEGRRRLHAGDVIMCGVHQLRFLGGGELADAPAPPVGAEQRLNQTMHGIPSVPPPQAGAQQRLSNTIHGVPTAPPARPAQLSDTMHGIPNAPPVPDGAQHRLSNTMHGMPSAPGSPAASPPQLATLIARGGPFKGQRFSVLAPVTNIGRADYNDIVLADDSVSTVHAKLLRREGIWVLVDLDSTNGTAVDDHPVAGEAPLAPGSLVKLGDIVLMFEPTDDGVPAKPGGRTRVSEGLDLPPDARQGIDP